MERSLVKTLLEIRNDLIGVFLFFTESVSGSAKPILGDPGAVSGDGEKSLKRAKKIRAKKSLLDFSLPEFFLPVLDFSSSPLTAPGSPRMCKTLRVQ